MGRFGLVVVGGSFRPISGEYLALSHFLSFYILLHHPLARIMCQVNVIIIPAKYIEIYDISRTN